MEPEQPIPNEIISSRLLWSILIIIAVATAALLTYILYFKNSRPGAKIQGDVKLLVEAPQLSPSGSELSYKITIQNLSNSRLTNLGLEVFYPRGFTFLDSTPDPQNNNPKLFDFPDLMPGGEGSLVVVGSLEGQVEEVKVLNLKLHYIPENFRSAFVSEAAVSTTMLAPDVTLRLLAPPHLVTGQVIRYEMRIENVSSRAFSDLTLRIHYPEKFQYFSATVPPLDSQNQWKIPSLDVGDTKSIAVEGRLQDDPGKESYAEAEILVGDSSGQLSSAGRSFAFTQVLAPPLRVSHEIPKLVDVGLPGQALQYIAQYENVSQVGLSNVVIEVVFDTSIVDFSKFNSATGQIQAPKIVWIPASIPELLTVSPGQKGKFDFTIPISDRLAADLQKNPTVKSHIQFRAKELPEPIVGGELEFKVQSVLTLEAKATQITPDQYRIDLTVSNGVNDLSDAVLVATVPRADVAFLGDSITPEDEKNSVQFIPDAGSIHWQIGDVFAFSGSFHESRKLSFVLRAPAALDTGTSLVLLKDIQVSATDQFTGNKISSNQINQLTNR